MENLKLTVEIAAAYPNAFVKTENFICRQVGITFDTQEFILKATGGVITDLFVAPISDCQLLLTPLSEISDEDAIEVAKLAISNSEIKDFKAVQIRREDYGVKVIIEWFGKEGLSMYWVFITNNRLPQFLKRTGSTLAELHYQFPIQAIDYLRSKSYDCGYGSIPSLLTAAIAINNEVKK